MKFICAILNLKKEVYWIGIALLLLSNRKNDHPGYRTSSHWSATCVSLGLQWERNRREEELKRVQSVIRLVNRTPEASFVFYFRF